MMQAIKYSLKNIMEKAIQIEIFKEGRRNKFKYFSNLYKWTD